MKCDYCGSNLTIDDKVCPYCHQPNKHYVKHRQDMFHYETDYQNTKSEVYEKAGKTSRRAARIAVLAVMVMLVLGAVVVNVYVWDIQRAVNMYREKKHLTEYQTQLDAYADSASVSSWARSAMEWAVGAGLIQGSAGQLAPQGTAMRAETAVILARFAQLAQ